MSRGETAPDNHFTCDHGRGEPRIPRITRIGLRPGRAEKIEQVIRRAHSADTKAWLPPRRDCPRLRSTIYSRAFNCAIVRFQISDFKFEIFLNPGDYPRDPRDPRSFYGLS